MVGAPSLIPRLSGREGWGGERFRELAWGRGVGRCVCGWPCPQALGEGGRRGKI